MSTYKTQVNQAETAAFISEHLHMPNVDLEAIANGEGSQAFFFESPDGGRVLRVNSRSNEGFLKDQFAYEHFGSDQIPIPKVLEVGEISEGLHFAVSERSPGLPLDELPTPVIDRLVPEVITILGAIHAVKPIGEGFGQWDLKGNGTRTSWRETVEAMRDDKGGDELITAGYFDPALGASVRKEITNLLAFCPEERRLVHGDFGFGNVIAEEGGVTGVIDWHPSMYGDPLFDVAWLAYWDDKRDYVAYFKDYYKSRGSLPENYYERIACYELAIGVQSLSFFAKSEQEDKYHYAAKRITEVKR